MSARYRGVTMLRATSPSRAACLAVALLAVAAVVLMHGGGSNGAHAAPASSSIASTMHGSSEAGPLPELAMVCIGAAIVIVPARRRRASALFRTATAVLRGPVRLAVRRTDDAAACGHGPPSLIALGVSRT